MLATRNRLRTASEFSTTVRSGVRNGRRNLVLYAVTIADDEPSRIGFIVSKSVGNAVARNLVKRRLREIGAASLREYSTGFAIVVRALPASATAGWDQLSAEYTAALETTMNRLVSRLPQAATKGSNGTTQEGTQRA
ncbi:ribonuclease P protein component [Pseudarthrobacter sp. N5]|uniref:ribonuclease P protein component n=1 Tax=Pseudarthrobacter sp. N5 TaxID=3418416 RepID=UPI003CEEBCD9